jgi:DNA mismatch endonuclease (patch repair protein)
MADVVDKVTRSRMMSGIRAKNTKPEIFMRQGLHALGFRYRIHVIDIHGRPDIVLPKYRALIVVHGCFWHGHDCRYFKLPSTRPEFWLPKIDSNRQRDKRDLENQLEKGWRVLTVWECAIRASMRKKPSLDCVALAAAWLESRQVSATIDEQGLRGV